MSILIIDFGCPNVKNIAQFMVNRMQSYYVYTPDKVPYDLSNIIGIILSGGPDSVINADIPTISSRSIPMLGICYGAQLIAKMLRGSIEKLECPVDSWKEITVDNTSDIYRNLSKNIYVCCKHADVITSLPKDCIITSEIKELRAIMSFEHKEYNIYGVQFHPDVLESKEGDIILSNFIKICHDHSF